MDHSRRGFIKWSAGASAVAGLKPSWLWADTANPFAGFGLAAAGKLNTRPSSAIGASPLSVGYETLDRQHFDPVKTYQHAAQLGVKWARCQTGWARTEKTRGQYDFDWLSYFLIVDLVGYRGSTNWKGLLRGADHTPNPAFFAYRNLGALFDSETRKADPLTGAIYRITSLAALPLADYPLIIADETAFQTGD